MFSRPNPARIDLNSQIKEFLASGGKIQHIPTGVSGEKDWRDTQRGKEVVRSARRGQQKHRAHLRLVDK